MNTIVNNYLTETHRLPCHCSVIIYVGTDEYSFLDWRLIFPWFRSRPHNERGEQTISYKLTKWNWNFANRNWMPYDIFPIKKLGITQVSSRYHVKLPSMGILADVRSNLPEHSSHQPRWKLYFQGLPWEDAEQDPSSLYKRAAPAASTLKSWAMAHGPP